MKTMIIKMFAVTACWLLAVGAAVAQEKKQVSGTVTDAATGQPLAGVIEQLINQEHERALMSE